MVIKNIASIMLLLILDIIWLSCNKSNNEKMISKIQNSPLDVSSMRSKIAAFVCYVLMICGFFLFVKPNITKSKDVGESLRYGFMFGIIVYGIYNSISLCIFKDCVAMNHQNLLSGLPPLQSYITRSAV